MANATYKNEKEQLSSRILKIKQSMDAGPAITFSDSLAAGAILIFHGYERAGEKVINTVFKNVDCPSNLITGVVQRSFINVAKQEPQAAIRLVGAHAEFDINLSR